MRKSVWTALGLLGLAAASAAQPFYVRGEFNGWGLANPMTDLGGGHYFAEVTGLTPGGNYQFKAANESWSIEAPTAGGNLRAIASAAGTLRVHFYDIPTPGDGWFPDTRRAGYEDLVGHGWEIMGSFNGWSSPALTLTNLGGGNYTGTMMVTAGNHEFKFRKPGDWNVTIGPRFADNTGNISLALGADAPVRFDIDMVGGRYNIMVVPEPATLGALALGALALARRRRR
jgi:hypothetical protein